METSLASPSGPVTGTLKVLELGTNSLKLHRSMDDFQRLEPLRVEWDLGYEVYSSGRTFSEETVGVAQRQVQSLLAKHRVDPARDPVLGIATGAFRDAENASLLLDRLHEELGVPVRVLSVGEEASLLMKGARELVPERPGMVFDLGGGSLQRVYFGANGTSLRDVLPLGAIWIDHLGSFASPDWDEGSARRWIKQSLQTARRFRLPVVHGTGGTVKAIAQVAGGSPISLEELRRIEKSTRQDGPPSLLSDRRREIFLPGLVVVSSFLEHVGARSLHYTRVDLGEVLMAGLRPIQGALRGPMLRSFLDHHFDFFCNG